MEFWIVALIAALLAAAWLARPLLTASGAAPAEPEAARDVQVFRDQLRTLERDVERGVLPAAEAEGTKAEISRRLLAAAAQAERQAPAQPAPRAASRGLAVGLAVAVLAGGGGLYALLGAGGLPDRPLQTRLAEIQARQADRPSQAEAEARLAASEPAAETPEPSAEEARMRDLIGQLRTALAERPDDVRGRRLLADSLMRLGDMTEAKDAMQEVVDLQGDSAPAEDRVALAEAMIMAAGGYVSPQAEAQLGRALQADPENSVARYYAGLALAQTGRYGLALRFWRTLLAEGPADAPWIAPIRAQIGDLEQAAAQSGQLAEAGGPSASAGAPALPGPSREQMEAAGEMSTEDRAAMIEGMVANLAQRLASEGGTPEEWARLIRALGVLGRGDEAAEIYAEARATFESDPAGLAAIEDAARAAGVAP
ncbi:c-type cytochrome biogenesis protein CcmI [Albimonas sp. CAU 1670]|uniref:c-type cytochrome biogenesis protein CcmI n=1 Tax=Albimonas sp. CAU 1670 TaxID=3032599 RepID=UPI0023D98292|nr:c-type cytochrome biogenesis protein CcmI [Albimonas sp. CAU 1670]MDF2234061.1 c-type cytochrome biogenesis protein CcmI [Albimonas sp. CAU 1670]